MKRIIILLAILPFLSCVTLEERVQSYLQNPDYDSSFCTGLDSQNEPIDNIDVLSSRENSIIHFIDWHGLPPSSYTYNCIIYDGGGEEIHEIARMLYPSSSHYTWTKYKIDKSADTPGTWKFEIYLNDVLILTDSVIVDFPVAMPEAVMDLDTFGQNGCQFIQWVVDGNINEIKSALDRGVSPVFVQDAMGMSSLFHAMRENNREIFDLLREHGASTSSSVSWLELYAGIGKLENVEMIFRQYDIDSEPVRDAFYYAITNKHNDIVKYFIDSGIDIHGNKYLSWHPPLIAAAAAGNHEIVELLLNLGADINMRSRLGYTAISFAAVEGHLDTVSLFMDRGADLSLGARHGVSLYEYVDQYCDDANRGDMLVLLLQAGAQ